MKSGNRKSLLIFYIGRWRPGNNIYTVISSFTWPRTTDRVAHPVSYEEAKFTADKAKEIPKQCIVFQLGS